MVENGDVKYGGKLWCGMFRRTVMWSVVENGDVGAQRVIL